MAAELAGPPFPTSLRYLWTLFAEIVDGLDGSGWGPAVVTWQALEAWSRVTGVTIEPREAAALVKLGAVRAEVASRAHDD